MNTSTVITNNNLIADKPSQGDGCEMIEICEFERDCEQVHIGDEWIPNGECTPWESTGNCWTEEYCGNGSCDYAAGESCQCQLYGMGCEGDEEVFEDPPTPTDPFTQAQPAENKTKTLAQNNSFLGAKTNIQTAASDGNEHGVSFGKDAAGNITASPMTNGGTFSGGVNAGWLGGFADLHNHPNDAAPSAGDLYGLVNVNYNHPGYDTRMVITPSGAVYAFVIQDLAKANLFVSTYPKQQVYGYPPEFHDTVLDEYSYAITHTTSGTTPLISDEMAMAYILDKFDSGIVLLKQSSNGEFSRLQTNATTQSNLIKLYASANCP